PAGRSVLAADFAIHPDRDVEPVDIGDFVLGDDPGPDHIAGVEALAFGGAEHALHLDHLAVARRHVVEDRVTDDVVAGLFDPDVAPVATDDSPDLELVVEIFGVARPADVGVRTDDAEAVGDVVDRLLGIDIGRLRKRDRFRLSLNAGPQARHAAKSVAH